MFFFTSITTEGKPAGTIKLKEKPYRGLGIYEDVEGNKWDVHGIVGELIFARPYDLHDFRYSTADFDQPTGVVTTQWLGYNWEVPAHA